MGKITTLRELIGVIKDKVSQSKAAITSKPSTLSLHLAILRATTHTTSTPPEDHQISAILTLGDSSRATASVLIESLMDRLHRTGNSTVALKCLYAVHHIIRRGPFILQDQLSIFPTTGGRNYLNLSSFRDGASAATWVLSAWVRWYAKYLETLLSTSRTLGFILCSSSCNAEREKQQESISSFTNLDLIRDVDSLVVVIEEICDVPDNLLVEGNKLLYEVIGLLGNDYLSAVNEILLRLGELKERLSCLSFNDSVELARGLKRLENCKEKLSRTFRVKKPSMEILWEMVKELSEEVGMEKVGREKTRKLPGLDRRIESARFGDRVVRASDSVEFSSGRFGLSNYSLMALEEERVGG